MGIDRAIVAGLCRRCPLMYCQIEEQRACQPHTAVVRSVPEVELADVSGLRFTY